MSVNVYLHASSHLDFKSDKRDSYKNLVYNSVDMNNMVRKNDHTINLSTCEITQELLMKELCNENSNRNKSKMVIIPRISDDYDMVKYAYDNKLINDDDLALIFMNLVVCFNQCIDVKILNFVYEKNNIIPYNNLVTSTIINGDNSIENIHKLFDWYYEKNHVQFVFCFSFVLCTDKQSMFLSYVEKKGYDILIVNNFQIVQIACAYCSFDVVDEYLKIISNQSDSPNTYTLWIKNILNILIDMAAINKDKRVFNRLKNMSEELLNVYVCNNFNLILNRLDNNDFEIATFLLSHYYDKKDSELICKYIYEKESVKILDFFIQNSHESDINFHACDDMLFRYTLIDENYDFVQKLILAQKKIGSFDDLINSGKLNDVIDDITNTKIIKLLEDTFFMI
jgi:hypothetical protein